LIQILIVVVALAGITLGAELLVRGASLLALRMGVSSLFVGLTIVGFGTSTPELGASVAATLEGATTVSVGNVLGSNLFNIGAILGITALMRPIHVKLAAVRRELLVALGAALLVFLAAPLGGIPPWLGAVFLALLAAFLWTTYRAARRAPQAEEMLADAELASTLARAGETQPKPSSAWSNLALILAGLALLLVGSRFFVAASLEIARSLGVPELVIGLTLVSAGTSLPELVTSVVAARRGNADIAIGNVIGSNVFNVLGILGVAAVVGRQDVPRSALLIDAPLMVLATLALLPILKNDGRISRVEGGLLLGGYVVYAAAMALR
jgi:cation:H+ antiporter